MARCEQGYLCDVCGEEVEDIAVSDLYLSYIIGEVKFDELQRMPERHIRCSPVQAQFIVAEGFDPVIVHGPFSKSQLDPQEVGKREALITRGWQRLQEVQQLGLAIREYPLAEAYPPAGDA